MIFVKGHFRNRYERFEYIRLPCSSICEVMCTYVEVHFSAYFISKLLKTEYLWAVILKVDRLKYL